MNKKELIAAVAEKTAKAHKEVEIVVNAMMDITMETVAAGDRVILVNFGTFVAKDRQARMGVKPGTTEKLEIPATRVPSFKAGEKFRSAVK